MELTKGLTKSSSYHRKAFDKSWVKRFLYKHCYCEIDHQLMILFGKYASREEKAIIRFLLSFLIVVNDGRENMDSYEEG